ncbi:MAG: gluconate 2-dehydrogenase subunit 3 family protein [Acidobacteria bacterium]|nr:gluconate 2-dehydrogenase subunit 3 family protein [Acidobacteriota bacterium]
MTKQGATRRTFLVRAAAGAGAVAGAGLVPDADAQDASKPGAPNAQAPTQPRPTGSQHGAFFNHDDAATIAAFTERLMPSAPGKPGAREAGVLNYLDLALAGAYADLQDFYRRGLAQLDAYCRATYHEPFARLDAARQDEVIASLENGRATGFTWPDAQELFNTLRTHTMEGMFADPIYGGNRDFAGWRLVGFPGAQAVFTSADMQRRQAFTRVPMVGLQVQAKGPS